MTRRDSQSHLLKQYIGYVWNVLLCFYLCVKGGFIWSVLYSLVSPAMNSRVPSSSHSEVSVKRNMKRRGLHWCHCSWCFHVVRILTWRHTGVDVPHSSFFFILVGYCKRERGYFGHSWLYCFARWRKDMYTVCFLRISCWRESCSEFVSDILRSWWVYPSLPHIYHSFFGRTILIQPSSMLYQTTLISLKLRVTERKSYRFSLCNIQYVVVFGVTVPSVVKT